MSEFKKIHIENWRQFGEVDIDLSHQTTVLTGSNGCGKTTLLNILSRHFGWNWLYVSTPFLSKRQRKKIYSDLASDMAEDETRPDSPSVGWIDYDDGARCNLRAPEKSSQNPQYHLHYDNMQEVMGIHVPSHRPPISYQSVDQIPTNPKNPQQLYSEFQQLLFQSVSARSSQNPGLLLKQSLVSLAVFGFGSEAVVANQEYRDIFESFQSKLRVLLPPELGFQKIEVRMPDVVLVTSTGDFSLDAMSGGVSSVLGIAWQIHIFGVDKATCTIVIDEPENHLHPRMQRTLLPNLERAFEKYKFIVATHSPFIVASNENAAIYGLRHSGDGKTRSMRLDSRELSSSTDQVLREVLDVPIVIPLWVEDRIKSIIERNPGGSEANIRAIYDEIRSLGLASVLPEFSRHSKQE